MLRMIRQAGIVNVLHPGVVNQKLGNLLGILLALVCVRHLGRWPDRLINVLSIGGMSLSFLIVIIAAIFYFLSLSRSSELVVARASGRSAFTMLLSPLIALVRIMSERRSSPGDAGDSDREDAA